mmetsp:Transcript_13093/g.24098  ORF Transcript_13093/g.24098 Transcript_13093/m.24098 type:complete len:568 (-) Transcript_13093:96-1799(-)
MAPQSLQFFQCGVPPRCGAIPGCRNVCSRQEAQDESAGMNSDVAQPIVDSDAPLLISSCEAGTPVQEYAAQLENDGGGEHFTRTLTAEALGELKLSLEPTQQAQEPSEPESKLQLEQIVESKSASTPPRNQAIRRGRSQGDLAGNSSAQVLQRGRTVGSLASVSSAKSTTASTVSTSAAQGHMHSGTNWTAQERGIPESSAVAADKAPRRLLSLETLDTPEGPAAAAGFSGRAQGDAPPELRRWHSALDMPGGSNWRKARRGRHKRLNRSASVESRQTSSAASTQTDSAEGSQRTSLRSRARSSSSSPSPLARRLGQLGQFASKLSSLAGLNAGRIAPATPSRDASPSRNFCLPQNAVIIFDWDDTLCPTYWAGSNRTTEAIEASREQLIFHAQAVRTLLRSAHAVARVAIVTLATLDWVKASARRFLLNIDFEGLLRELEITVHSAKLDLKMAKRTQDPRVVAKRRAMSTCLKKMYGWSPVPWNVISIGDSTIERQALQELLLDEGVSHTTFCKTVKLDSDPSLSELTKQVRMITPLLKDMVYEEAAFDRTRLHLEHEHGCNSFSL